MACWPDDSLPLLNMNFSFYANFATQFRHVIDRNKVLLDYKKWKAEAVLLNDNVNEKRMGIPTMRLCARLIGIEDELKNINDFSQLQIQVGERAGSKLMWSPAFWMNTLVMCSAVPTMHAVGRFTYQLGTENLRKVAPAIFISKEEQKIKYKNEKNLKAMMSSFAVEAIKNNPHKFKEYSYLL